MLIVKLTGNKERFDYKIFFSEVFDHRGGFDVIANRLCETRGHKGSKPRLRKSLGHFIAALLISIPTSTSGIDLLKSSGHLCFIAPNKFMRAGYRKEHEELLAEKVTPKSCY